MDKVTVIGGSGFLGSHVADELTRRGYNVTVLDRVSSPWVQNAQEIVVGDMLDGDLVRKVCDGSRYLYHFGGIADIEEAKTKPFETIESNVLGATTALEVSRTLGVERFIYASSIYVYSAAGSFYRASKQSVETIVEAYSESFGLDYTLLRYGSLYGPRAQTWNGIRRYVQQIVEEGKLDYEGSGEERREYIHVLDAARLSVDILSHDYRNEAITVTGTQILNSNELIEMIFEIAGKKTNVKYLQTARSQEHYRMTPYRYSPRSARKLVPSEFVDIGQGILEVVEETHKACD